MIGSDPAPAQRVNELTAGGNNLQKRAVVTRLGGGGGLTHALGWRGVDGRWVVGGDQQGGCCGKNVIRESAMSNLQQSHHLTGVEVDASASALRKLQSYPVWEQKCRHDKKKEKKKS